MRIPHRDATVILKDPCKPLVLIKPGRQDLLIIFLSEFKSGYIYVICGKDTLKDIKE